MGKHNHWEHIAASNSAFVTYQLSIFLERVQLVTVGSLGRFKFPAGNYVYTGSARRNLVARVNRHLRRDKPLRWHIDYLLVLNEARVIDVHLSDRLECECNKNTPGEIIVPGFGASDCKTRCVSHLKYQGNGIEDYEELGQ